MIKRLRTGHAIVVGVSLALAVICFLLFVFRVLPGEAGWHLRLLHTRPEHFLQIVEEAENESSPEREAILKYIRSPAGTRRLVELYARDMLDNVSLRGSPETQLAFRAEDHGASIYTYAATGRIAGGRRCDEARLRVVHSLLDLVEVESIDEFVLEGYQGLRLLVRRQPVPVPSRSGPTPTMMPAYVCTVRAASGVAASGVASSRPFGIAPSRAGIPDSLVARKARAESSAQMALLESVLAGPEETRWEAACRLGSVRRKDDGIVTRLSRALATGKLEELEVLLEALEPLGPGRAQLVPTLSRRLELALAGGRIDACWTAISALGRIGPQAARSVPVLRRAIKHEDKELRVAVMRALAQIGPPARSAIPDLVETLEIRNRSLRMAALEALGGLQPGAEVAPALVRCLRHGDSLYNRRRFLASDVLCQIGEPAVPQLIEALTHEHPTVRQGVAEALARMADLGGPASSALEAALDDPELSVRVQAAAALYRVAGAREAAVRVLREGLHSENEETRDFTLYCLSRLESPPTAFVRDLVELVSSERNESEALYQLERIGPRAASIVPILLARLSQDDRLIDGRCRALRTIAPGDARVVAALVTLLRSGSERGEVAAAREIAELGQAARSALPYLLELLRALAGPPGEATAPPAGRGIVRSGVLIPARAARCRAVVDALAGLGPMAGAAVPTLEDLLEHEEAEVRLAAAEALWRIAREIDLVAPVLLAELRWPAPSDSHQIDGARLTLHFASLSRVLVEMRIDEAIPELLLVLRDPGSLDRFAAAVALSSLEEHRAEALAVLRAGLRSDARSARSAAASAAGRLGAAAKPLLPLLKSLQRDAYRRVFWAAGFAVRTIEAESLSNGAR